MSTTLIPDSAPFTDEQKSWLNGFFAGLLGIDENAVNNPQVLNAAIGALPDANGTTVEEQEEEFPWHDPGMELEERQQLAQGKPFKRRLMAVMAQLDCGSCGYDCQTYAEAIADGSDKSLTKCVPGGKETSRALKKLMAEAPTNGQAPADSNGAATNGKAVSESKYHRDAPFTAKLLRSDKLNKEGSAKDTRHVEIDLSGSDLKYRVGDALGVYPTNCDELVGHLIAHLELDAEAKVVTKEGSTTLLRLALNENCCLKEISDDFIEAIKSQLTDQRELNRFDAVCAADEIDDMDVLDLLQEFPTARFDPQSFVSSLSPLQPRLYSIASSQSVVGEQVHLTIGRTMSEIRNRLRKGVASTMFSDRMEAGNPVRVFVQPSHGFALPSDPAVPIIMVGPGTGIAPFRAFLQERIHQKSPGKSWVFFGDQKQACDFLYEEEFQGYLNDGVLTRLDTAFSRDQERKVYVQDRMREHAAELFAWLEEGAHFYVCGDAKRMAKDVDTALQDIVQSQGNKSSEEAKQYVKQLAAAGRYQRDVY